MERHPVTLFLLFLVLHSCSTTWIELDKPVTGNLPERPPRLTSEIGVPLEIDISQIEKLINRELPSGRFINQTKKESDEITYSYQVFRNRPVKFSAEGNELVFRIPIDIRAKGTYSKCLGTWYNGRCYTIKKKWLDTDWTGGLIKSQEVRVPGVVIRENAHVSPSVDLELRVKLGVNADYSLDVKTKLNASLTGDKHLHMDLFGDLIRINIDFRKPLNKLLQSALGKIQGKVDQEVNKIVGEFNLREKVATYWNQLGHPIPIRDMWLKIEPEGVIFENLHVRSNKLRVGVGMYAKMEISGNKPISTVRPLPNLILNRPVDGSFQIYLPVTTEFKSLQEQVAQKVIGKVYKFNKAKLEILELEMEGVNMENVNAILVRAYIKGKYKFKRFEGNIYFKAVPSLDDGIKEVSISDFRLEAKTNSFLINAGLNYLVNSTSYYEDLKNELTYSYRREYDKFLSLINHELKEVVVNQLVINGELKGISVPGLFIDPTSLEVLLIANGNIESSVDLNRVPVDVSNNKHLPSHLVKRDNREGDGGITGPSSIYSQLMRDGRRWTTKNLNVEISGSSCYNDNLTNCNKYGRLYTWKAAERACARLGEGWRLPTAEEWKTLAEAYGGYVESYKSKSKTWRGTDEKTTIWTEDIGSSTKSYESLQVGGKSGFDVLLGGYADDHRDASYAALGRLGYYWSSTGRAFGTNTHGISVRFSEVQNWEIDVESAERRPPRSGVNSIYSCRCIKEVERRVNPVPPPVVSTPTPSPSVPRNDDTYRSRYQAPAPSPYSANQRLNTNYQTSNLPAYPSGITSAASKPKGRTYIIPSVERKFREFSVDSIQNFGFTIGNANRGKLGVYFTAIANANFFRSAEYQLPAEENLFFTGGFRRKRLDLSTGLTLPRLGPFSIYLGGGAAYRSMLWMVDVYDDQFQTLLNTDYAASPLDTEWLPIIETGLVINLGPLALRYGLKSYDLETDSANWWHSAGIGFSWIRW